MQTKLTALLLIFVSSLLLCSQVMAQDKKFDWGIIDRTRIEYRDDVFNFQDGGSRPSDQYIREKLSVWGKWDPCKYGSLFVKFSGEPYIYIGHHSGDDFVNDEIILDNFYIDIKKPWDLPLDFRIGRQDFPGGYGEGFLIMDGTPGDGSRTMYFNAAQARWTINKNHSLDMVYVSDPIEDQYFWVINNRHRALNTSDEQGFMIYEKGKYGENLSVEPYYIFKREDKYSTTPKLDIHTLGAFGAYKMDPWKFRAQFAHQFGEYEGGRDRDANGGYFFVDRGFKDTFLKPEASIGFVYLSGDKPGTSKNEDWDPLFSRYPYLSELYIFPLSTEKKIAAYWTNVLDYRASVKLNFDDKTNLNLGYNYMRALENPDVSGSIFTNDGKERGHLLSAKLYHKFTKQLDGYILGEYFIPGDFYIDGSDNATFIRTEIQYKF